MDDTTACVLLLPGCCRAKVLSVWPGPTSSRTRSESWRILASPSEKRTVCRRCAAQYSGSTASSARTQSPVRLDTHGIVGSSKEIVRRNARNSSRTGATSSECAATEMWIRRASTPRSASPRSMRAMAADSPDNTHASGRLMAAIETPSPTNSRAAASDSATPSIAPSGSRSNSSPRLATSAIASSKDNAPPRHAAAYSPALCPINAVGSTPHAIHSRAMAYSTANSAGRARDGRSNISLASPRSGGG